MIVDLAFINTRNARNNKIEKIINFRSLVASQKTLKTLFSRHGYKSCTNSGGCESEENENMLSRCFSHMQIASSVSRF